MDRVTRIVARKFYNDGLTVSVRLARDMAEQIKSSKLPNVDAVAALELLAEAIEVAMLKGDTD